MLQVFSNYLSCYLQFGSVGYVLDLRKTESDEAVNIKAIYKLSLLAIRCKDHNLSLIHI